MDLAGFVERNWDKIAANPAFFVVVAVIFFAFGSFSGKLLYSTLLNVTKERLEAARDDLARLERAKREESETVTRLQEQLVAEGASNEGRRVPFGATTVPEHLQPPNIISHSQAALFLGAADTFFLRIPHPTLDEALEEARKTEKLVFLVVYDETHPRQSKLNYSLGYFMEYHTTKKLVDNYFAPAVVKASSPKVAELIPSDDPLENSLWVVLRPDGEVLRREGVYANPDEGLKRVRAVIAEAGNR